MNFSREKILLVICILGGILSSCIKRVDVKASEQESKVFINCLFNPDSSWKVYIGRTRNLPGKDSSREINDATVRIKSESAEFTLSYVGDGKYTYSEKRPQPGVSYKIEVQVPDHKPIYAFSKIPEKSTIVSSNFDTITTYFVPDNVFDHVPGNRVELTLHSPSDTVCYYELLGYKYNVDTYTEFIINDRVLEKLRQYRFPDHYGRSKLPEDYIEQLAQLKGKNPVGQDSLFKLIGKYTHTDAWNYLVYNFCETIRHSPPVYDPKTFWATSLYSKGGNFYNITGDSHGVFGQILDPDSSDAPKIRLFMGEIYRTQGIHDEFNENRITEAWVELYSLSQEMYRYQTSYLNQIINEQDPFAEPVQVYSNIHNGIGIFAGYQTERIKIY